MHAPNLQLKLEGRRAKATCGAGVECDCDNMIAHGVGGTGKLMKRGCEKFGGCNWSDLFMRDGRSPRREMQSGGEWNNAVVDNRTKADWVIQTKERVLVASNEGGRMRGCDYRMPYVQAEVGMAVGYVRDIYTR
jgi:hypothetical protein